MMHLRSRRRHDEDGQVAVEAALVAPLLFFIIFMIIEAGPLFLMWSSNKHAAQEGARAASISGTDSTADYDMLRAMVAPLEPVGSRLDYVIIFRAKNLYSRVPPICITEADKAITELGATANPSTPVGVFQATSASVPMTRTSAPATPSADLTTFNWALNRPAVACNIYRKDTWKQSLTKFQYDELGQPLSMDRFWPASKRNNQLTATVRQDYVGVYVQGRYTSMTGAISSRVISNTFVGSIEARKAG
jgi:TadE-like protein